MECRERAMGEYRVLRSSGVSREEARMVAESGKGLGHAVGDQCDGGGEAVAGGVSGAGGQEEGGYTHAGPSAGPSDEELMAYAEMYKGGDDRGGTYMLGLVLMLIMAFGLGLIVGIIIGRAVYGI